MSAPPTPSAASRRVPPWSELRPLLGVQRPTLRRTARALERAQTIGDLRAIARRRVPGSVFDYVDGAAEGERSLARSRGLYAGAQFAPRVLRDVARVDSSVEVLGARSPMPVVLAPTGFTRMMHHEGERAVGRAAAAAGVPYTLSTMGTVAVEDLANAAPGLQRWFQLYLWKDRGRSRELVDRVSAAGYDTLVLTVDTPVAGRRLRDNRNGLTIPPQLTARTLGDMALHPRWWANLLTTEPLEFASLSHFAGTIAELVDQMFDPSVTWADLAWLRESFDGRIVVKGVQHRDDAAACVDAGADGVVVSNHGGRQLDQARSPLEALPEVLDAVRDRAAVLVDGGITSGADVVTAVAHGADAVLVGRGYLYGLMAGGEAGVARALAILQEQVTRTMRLLGVTSVTDLHPGMVRLPGDVPSTAPPRNPA